MAIENSIGKELNTIAELVKTAGEALMNADNKSSDAFSKASYTADAAQDEALALIEKHAKNADDDSFMYDLYRIGAVLDSAIAMAEGASAAGWVPDGDHDSWYSDVGLSALRGASMIVDMIYARRTAEELASSAAADA